LEEVLPFIEADDARIDDRLAIRDGLAQDKRFGFLGLHPSQAEQERESGCSLFHVMPMNHVIMRQRAEMSNVQFVY
jgi:hypothetical protein